MSDQPIRLRVGIPYEVPGGTLTVKAGEMLPNGKTKLWLELVRPDGNKIRGVREMSQSDMARIREQSERRREDRCG